MLEDVDRFLTENDFSPATSATYAYHLHRMAMWMYERGVESADSLSGVQIKCYLNGQNWKANTRRAAGNAAKSFLKWRYGAGHPALSIKLPKDDAAPGRALAAPQLDQLMALFDTSKPVGWRNLAIIALMVETGLRISEICRLEMEHLHLQQQRLFVLAKGRVWREGVFSDVTAQYLDIWLRERPKYVRRNVRQVFVSVNGKTKGGLMTAAGLRANFRKYGLKADIGALSPHDLRRTMATLLIEGGAPTRLVQELGKWADIRMVERYTRTLKPSQINKFSPVMRSMKLSK